MAKWRDRSLSRSSSPSQTSQQCAHPHGLCTRRASELYFPRCLSRPPTTTWRYQLLHHSQRTCAVLPLYWEHGPISWERRESHELSNRCQKKPYNQSKLILPLWWRKQGGGRKVKFRGLARVDARTLVAQWNKKQQQQQEHNLCHRLMVLDRQENACPLEHKSPSSERRRELWGSSVQRWKCHSNSVPVPSLTFSWQLKPICHYWQHILPQVLRQSATENNHVPVLNFPPICSGN